MRSSSGGGDEHVPSVRLNTTAAAARKKERPRVSAVSGLYGGIGGESARGVDHSVTRQ
jgi:hypothetical protein